MIVIFCGHAEFVKSAECERKFLGFLQEKIGDLPAEMYLGGYGNFDSFAYDCCKKYKATHPQISLLFVTPYLTDAYQYNRLKILEKRYDAIVYLGIEDKPKRYAITYRNRRMVEKADCVIAYISHCWGGAYATYKYAKRQGKEIFNLANFVE